MGSGRTSLVAATIAVAAILSWAPAALADGAALYKADCASCHGDDGKAQTPVGKAMKVPALAGGSHPVEQLTKMVRTNPKHKSVSGKVSDEDLQAIAEYLKTL
jgi:mono/diheme cytochrome c family protein